MSMFAMYKNNKKFNDEIVSDSLSGNLCRCTGYRPIIDAAKSLNKKKYIDEFSKLKKKQLISLKKLEQKI